MFTLDKMLKVRRAMSAKLKQSFEGYLPQQESYRNIAEGHFRLECLDAENRVVDVYDNHNMIVTTARRSMAEIFFASDCAHAHRLVLGTQGAKDVSIYKAKDETDGLSKSRTCIFSEIKGTYAEGTMIDTLLKGDVIKVGENYYRADADFEGVVVSTEVLSSDFTQIQAPFTYSVEFAMTGVDTAEGENICTSSRSDVVKAKLSDTSVIFTFYIDADHGNDQNNTDEYDIPTTLFNEAGLYVNGRLFAMRTFPSKIKDETVKLRVIWTITF